jgi:uncharacterized protein
VEIDESNVADLAVGCTILAAGGGGTPHLGLLFARETIRALGPVRLVGLDELDGVDHVLPVGMMGAPTLLEEKIPGGAEGELLRRTVERCLGVEVGAFMPLELGGINGVLPVAFAGRAGLPLVDADLMGRAFPELQMCTPHLYGVRSPIGVVVDERSQVVVHHPMDDLWLEKLARGTVTTLGGCACCAIYPMPVDVARKVSLTGTLSSAMRIGEAIRNAAGDPIGALAEALPLTMLLRGKILDIERHTGGGFVRGSMFLEGTGDDDGRLARIEFQNENLVVLEDGAPLAMVPDIITVLDVETGHGIVTEHLSYGQRVAVVAFPAPQPWKTEAGLSIVGPRAFGYDFDFVPVTA